MNTSRWTIAELRQRYIIWDEEYSLQLRSAYPDSAVVTADEVLRNLTFPPRVRFAFAVEMTGLGGKKLKGFAVDCAVCLLSLLKVDTPGYDALTNCVAELREYIDRPTMLRAKEVRKTAGKLHLTNYLKSDTTYREVSVRFKCASILGDVGLFSSKIQTVGPQKYDPFSPRQSARLAGWSAADHVATFRSRAAASLAAVEDCFQEIQSPRIDSSFRPLLAAWAGENCSMMVDGYRRNRLPDWTAIEIYEFACDDGARSRPSIDGLLSVLPIEVTKSVRLAIAQARKAAWKAYAYAEVNAYDDAIAVLAERMTEYVYGNPAPWDAHNVPSQLHAESVPQP